MKIFFFLTLPSAVALVLGTKYVIWPMAAMGTIGLFASLIIYCLYVAYINGEELSNENKNKIMH